MTTSSLEDEDPLAPSAMETAFSSLQQARKVRKSYGSNTQTDNNNKKKDEDHTTASSYDISTHTTIENTYDDSDVLQLDDGNGNDNDVGSIMVEGLDDDDDDDESSSSSSSIVVDNTQAAVEDDDDDDDQEAIVASSQNDVDVDQDNDNNSSSSSSAATTTGLLESPSSPMNTGGNDNDGQSNDDDEKEEESTPASSKQQEQEQQEQPSDEALMEAVDRIFVRVDKKSVTVKDVVRLLETEFQLEPLSLQQNKSKKKMVKKRLTDLITGVIQPNVSGAGFVDDDDFDDDSSSYSSSGSSTSSSLKPKNSKKEKKKHRKVVNSQTTTRRSGTPRQRQRSGMSVQDELLRRKEVSRSQRILQEEMQTRLSKEDQERAAAIAARFETETDEAIGQRLEDRGELLKKLLKKKMEVLAIHEPTPAAATMTDTAGRNQNDVGKMGTAETLEDESSSDEGSDDDDDDSSSDEMELEIVGGPVLAAKEPAKVKRNFNPVRSKPNIMDPRTALKLQLQKKRLHTSNAWLARELGYKDESAHIEECRAVDHRRKVAVQKEEEKNRRVLSSIIERKLLDEEFDVDSSDDEDVSPSTDMTADSIKNEEMTALASDNALSDPKPDLDEMLSDEVGPVTQCQSSEFKDAASATGLKAHNETERCVEIVKTDVDIVADTDLVSHEEDAFDVPAHDVPSPKVGESEDISAATHQMDTQMDDDESSTVKKSDDQHDEAIVSTSPGKLVAEVEGQTAELNSHDSPQQHSKPEEKLKKNAAWLAMLENEKKSRRRQKKSNLVDAEAEEEEEEDDIQGLEDFGFNVKKKKGDNDDGDENDDEIREDDLENVVDDISDNEGDEEAGEKARRELAAKEEKERHREMMRRMREGYDMTRRGGGTTRGRHRFDQLVAADNRKDAKRLGLLNEDELDSEDDMDEENASTSNEEDDENALLDKILKDRFLPRHELDPFLSEESSEDEGEDEKHNEKSANSDDEREREEDIIAKRFSRRARVQRFLETCEDSQLSRLIDEDETMKKELKSIEILHVGKRRQSSINTVSADSSLSADSSKRQKSSSSEDSSFCFSSKISSLGFRTAIGIRKQKGSIFGGRRNL